MMQKKRGSFYLYILCGHHSGAVTAGGGDTFRIRVEFSYMATYKQLVTIKDAPNIEF